MLPHSLVPFSGALVLWGVGELGLLLFRRSGTPRAAGRDAGTLPLIAVTLAICVPLSVWLAIHRVGRLEAIAPVAAVTGPVLILLGVAVRFWAVFTLRRFFTVDVAIHADHHVVTGGPYRWVRHPAYSGALLSTVGVALALASWAVLLCLLLPLTVALLRRINVEERALHAALGDAYAEFCRGRARLFPGLY